MKIVVIADDLTGAAEVAGAAIRYGLTADVHIGQIVASDVEVVVVDADSRSQSTAQAFATVTELTRQAVAFGADLLYKKADSLLRGPVLAEVNAMREASGLEQCLLVCGNPRKHRTVVHGQILIEGQPLQSTEFAFDPEHPRCSSCAVELLRDGSADVKPHWDMSATAISVIPPGANIDSPVTIGDASCVGDLDRHVHQWLAQRANTLAAGGAEFFEALLRALKTGSARGERRRDPAANLGLPPTSGRSLLVSGTRLSRCEDWTIVTLPPNQSIGALVTHVSRSFASENRVAIRAVDLANGSHCHRVELVTRVAASLLASRVLDQVWIEGGRTASTLIRQLGIHRLLALAEVGDGVVALREREHASPLFLIKPGSYPWPKAVIPPPTIFPESAVEEMV